MYTFSTSVLIIFILAGIATIGWSLVQLRRRQENARKVLTWGYGLGIAGVFLWAVFFGIFNI